MSSSLEHEEVKDLVVLIVNIWAEESGLDIRSFGSATLRREDLARGFEPDACFYIQSIERIRGKVSPDLTEDPPSDLISESDISNSSLDKLPIFAALAIPEVWRYDAYKLFILVLDGIEYVFP